MAIVGSLQLSHALGLCRNQGCNKQFKDILGRSKLPLLSTRLSLCSSFHFRQHDLQSIQLSGNLYRPIHSIPYRSNAFRCNSFLGPSQAFQLPCKKAVSVALKRSYNVIQGSPIVLKLASAIGVIMFSIWGVELLLRQSRNLLLRKNDNSWKKSGTYYVLISYIQPLLLWAGAILICRTVDPVVLPTEASQIVKLICAKSWLRILKLSSRGCIEFFWTMSILKIRHSWFVLHLSNMTASLVLASDGLWDEVSNQEAIDIVSAICMPDKKPRPLSDIQKDKDDDRVYVNVSPSSKIRRVSLLKHQTDPRYSPSYKNVESCNGEGFTCENESPPSKSRRLSRVKRLNIKDGVSR